MLLMMVTMQPAFAEPVAPDVYRRTVFIGDSITDGDTYPQLVRSALDDAKKPPMIAINSGIGGDTAAGMLKRLDRDVLVHRPTLGTFNAGANDALRGVPVADYERDVRAIAERLKKEGIPMILLTPNVLAGAMKEKGQANLDAYELVLRSIASEYGLRLAEVNKAQTAAETAGEAQLSEDNLHPNHAGQRSIARAVLDAMGYSDVAVPARAHLTVTPGIIPQWQAKPIPRQPAITDGDVAAVKPDDTWTAIHLPETDICSDEWLDDLRIRGASLTLRKVFPKENTFLVAGHVDLNEAKTLYIHPACEVSRAWLNGKPIYVHSPDAWTGYHIGRVSVPVEFHKGDNLLIMETGPIFFMSLADKPLFSD